MKKLFILVVTMYFVATFIIVGIKLEDKNKDEDITKNTFLENKQETRGIFFSYIEFLNYFDNTNESQKKKVIDNIILKLKENNFNTLYLHIRSFSDAIYNSLIFPTSYIITGKEGEKIDFDVLEYFIDKAHKEKISIQAWINPYRIRNNTDTSTISIKNPSYKWFGTNNVKVIDGKGIFYNPASSEVINLIVKGVEEVVKNYDVDGIMFDDYFYMDDTIDEENYQNYLKTGVNISKKEYRYMVVNEMVSKVSEVVHKYKKEFGISPSGNIENNMNEMYADIYTWINENYLDYIIPQIYYGFENTVKPFEETANFWNNLVRNKKVKLIIGLPLYKIGLVDEYAIDGMYEFVFSSNVIRRQIEYSRTLSNYSGFAIFRYGNYFDKDTEEVKNIKDLLKTS